MDPITNGMITPNATFRFSQVKTTKIGICDEMTRQKLSSECHSLSGERFRPREGRIIVGEEMAVTRVSDPTCVLKTVIVSADYALQRGVRKGHQDIWSGVATVSCPFGRAVNLVVFFQAHVCRYPPQSKSFNVIVEVDESRSCCDRQIRCPISLTNALECRHRIRDKSYAFGVAKFFGLTTC